MKKLFIILPALALLGGCTSSTLSPTPTTTASGIKHSFEDLRLGIRLELPREWPVPAYEESPDGWRLSLGPINEKGCEGEPCYDFFIDGYDLVTGDALLSEIQKSTFVESIADNRINGYRTITYTEGGICGYKKALILGRLYAYRLTARCGDDRPEISKTFDTLMAGFQSI